MSLKYFNQALTVYGQVTKVTNDKPDQLSFHIRARSGDEFEVFVGPETNYSVISNLDSVNRDRVSELTGIDREKDKVLYNLTKYIKILRQVVVCGVYQENDTERRF